jgi:hypothetical protein
MKELFRKYGVVKEPIDYTPTLQVDDFDKLENIVVLMKKGHLR